jgi:hypothetical protein
MNSWKLILLTISSSTLGGEYRYLVLCVTVNVWWLLRGCSRLRREPSLEVSSIRGASDTTQIPSPVLSEQFHFLLVQCKPLLVGC